jgi:hypothetical protein
MTKTRSIRNTPKRQFRPRTRHVKPLRIHQCAPRGSTIRNSSCHSRNSNKLVTSASSTSVASLGEKQNDGRLRPSHIGLIDFFCPGFCFRGLWTLNGCNIHNKNPGSCPWNHERPSLLWCWMLIRESLCSPEHIGWMLQCWDHNHNPQFQPRERFTNPVVNSDGKFVVRHVPPLESNEGQGPSQSGAQLSNASNTSNKPNMSNKPNKPNDAGANKPNDAATTRQRRQPVRPTTRLVPMRPTRHRRSLPPPLLAQLVQLVQ